MAFIISLLAGARNLFFGDWIKAGAVIAAVVAFIGWDQSRLGRAEERGATEQKQKQVHADEKAVEAGKAAIEKARRSPVPANDWLRRYACPKCKR